jgi:hypothetical protein
MECILLKDLDNINEFLKVLGTSLEVFRCLTYDDLGMFIISRSNTPTHQALSDGHHGCPRLDLTHNTHLRRIHFHFNRFYSDVLFATCTLSRIESRQLEEVAFNLDGSWGDEGFPNAEWIKVDAILASPQFASLKDVRICALPRAGANLPTLFATLLPTCHARGIISFHNTLLWQPRQL